MTRRFLLSSLCLSVLTLSACGSGGSDSSEPLPAPNQSEPLTTGSLPAPSNPAPSNPLPEAPISDTTEEVEQDTPPADAEDAGQLPVNNIADTLTEDVSAEAATYRLGVQLASVSSDMTAWMFNDLMKSAGMRGQSVSDASHGWFYSTSAGIVTDRPANILTDAQGWPTSMTLKDGTIADTIFTTVMSSKVQGAYETGSYTLTYEGQGAFSFDNADIIEQQDGQIVLHYAGTGPLTISVTQTDPDGTGNYLKNIQLQRPGANNAETFSADYVSYLTSSRVVRTTNLFSDAALYAKPGTESRFQGAPGWSQRSTMQTAHWGTVSGVPYEAMTELADKAIADLWLNIPLAADDAYVTAMAELLLTSLKTNRVLYIELGSELANRTYPQSMGRDYALARAKQRWPDAMQSELLANHSLLAKENVLISNWQAARTLEIQAIFDTVWNTEADRVVTVLAGTLNNTMKGYSYNAMLLDGMLLREFEGAEAPGLQADALAVDPVVVNNAANQFSVDSADAMLTDAINYVDGTGQYYEEAHAPGLRYAVRAAATLSQEYGIALTAYSGGHGLNASSYLNYQVLKSSQMYDVYQSVFSVWQEEGGGVFVAGQGIASTELPEYCTTATYSPANQVKTIGLKETQHQDESDAHMLRALKDEMRAIGQIK